MRLLLDTHVAIWALSRPHRLPPRIASLLMETENEVFVSVASVWELAIKAALGRTSAPDRSAKALALLSSEAGFEVLPIIASHASAVETLPMLHGDPFDRLLVAQALVEPMHLVTHDSKVAAYSDTFVTW